MLCPNCDSILNIRGCMSCGWQNGDSWPSHRLVVDSVHPLKPGDGVYPERPGTIVLRNFSAQLIVPEPAAVETEVKADMEIEPVIEPTAQAGGDSVPAAFAVGTLTDENGEQAGHVLVGPFPVPTNESDPATIIESLNQIDAVIAEAEPPKAIEAASGEKPIPNPMTETVQ